MSWQSNLPKGCPNIPYRPARTSGNTWSNELTKNDNPGTKYEVWLYYDVHPKPSGVTGKNFTMDLVFKYGNAYYFNWPETAAEIAFSFYSIVTQSWTDYRVYRRWVISDNSGVSPTTGLWNNYRNYGSYRPAWGVYTATAKVPMEITASGPTYAEFKEAALAVGLSEIQWDATNIHSYCRPMPWGMHYLSNGKNAQPGRRYPDPGPFVKRHGHQQPQITYAGLDKGGTTSGLINIDLDANYITSVCGSLAGVTAFKMRVRQGWGNENRWEKDKHGQDEIFMTYYFGGNQPNAYDEDKFTTIDNPQIGLLDYGPQGSKAANWPPRYDGQAWYRNKGGASRKLQAKYKPVGGDWNIF